MLFELSGKDANQFVRNVGYGFAAGYLMSHDIPIPASAKEIGEDDAKRLQGQIEDAMKVAQGQIEAASKAKEQEIMTV